MHALQLASHQLLLLYVLCRGHAEVWLAWLYVGSLLLMRVIVTVSVVHLVLFTKGNCDPTVVAKVRVHLSSLSVV